MKTAFLLILFLLLGLVSSYPASAERVVKVGIYDNKPLIYLDPKGQGRGFFADVLEHIASSEKWQIEYVHGTFHQGLSRLVDDQIDILCTVARSEDREEQFDFNEESLLTNWGQLVISGNKNINAIMDIDGRKIAVLKGDIYYFYFKQLIMGFGLSCEILETESYHSVLDLVSRNEADAGVVNRIFGIQHGQNYNVDKSGVIFSPIKLHYAVPTGKNQAILSTIDSYLKRLKSNKNSIYHRSLNKWLEIGPPQQSFLPLAKWILLGGAGIFLFLLGTSIVLRSQIRSKTKALTIELRRREQAEEALRESEKHFRDLAEMLPEGVFEADKDMKITYANQRALSLFGYKKEDISKGLNGFDVLAPEDRERAKENALRRFHGENIGAVEYRGLKKDGSTFPVLYHNDPIINQNVIEGVRGIIVDLTESKKAEKILKQNEEKLARSKKMESLGLLAGGVAHDLNNVLAGIVSYPDLILMGLPEDSKFRKSIETIQASGNRAAAIVQDLLTVARGVATTKEPLNLNDIVGDYLISPEFNKLSQHHPSVEIITDLHMDLLNIKGSQVHITKVVMNLVSNAAEAIKEKGRVTVSTMNRYLDYPLIGYNDVNVGEYVVLSVSDNGPGISSDDLERIFEPFYTKKVMGRSGTGLGLAVVWNVLQDHDGYIDVKSDGNGTVFELYFPITRDEVSDKPIPLSLNDCKGNGEAVLVVDDIESQRDISCKMLAALGYKANAVSSGEEAVEHLKQHSYELVLLDMIMDPGINGYETYEQILIHTPRQKAIIVSGYAETAAVKETQKLGAGKYIKKPLTLESLGPAIREELEK